MTRAVVIAFVGVALVVSACGGGDGNTPAASGPCPLLAQLAKTGESVSRADVADPAKFDATLRSAVAEYVRIAHRLRAAVPLRLRADVELVAAAAEQYRFSDATTARANIDSYERSKCDSRSSG
jgi:hypothetical protein